MSEPIRVPVAAFLAAPAHAIVIEPQSADRHWPRLVPELREGLLMSCRGWLSAYLRDYPEMGLADAANGRASAPTEIVNPSVRPAPRLTLIRPLRPKGRA